MATNRSTTYRIYANELSQFKSLKTMNLPGEIQIVLEFASEDMPTPGQFKPDWSTSIMPDVISEFKTRPNFKFFASIGRNSFSVKPIDEDKWIANAQKSLRGIIDTYHLDGIDVYYQRIDSDTDLFLDAVGKVLANLKEEKNIISTVAATADLNHTYYYPLFGRSSSPGTVLYQWQ